MRGFLLPKQRYIFRLALVVIGLLFGYSIHNTFLLKSSSQLPPNWQREPLQIPYKLAAHLGDNTPMEDWITLDYYRGIYPQNTTAHSIELDFWLPEDGQIEIWLRAPEAPRSSECETNVHAQECRRSFFDSTGVIFEHIGKTAGTKVLRGKGKGTAVCQTHQSPQGKPIPKLGKNHLSVEKNGSQVVIRLNDEDPFYCNAVLSNQPPLIRPGIRSIQISNINLDGKHQPIKSPPSVLWFLIVGIIFGLGLSFVYLDVQRKNVRLNSLLLEISPLFGIFPMLFIDHLQWIEALRAPWLPWLWLPTLIPFLVYLLGILTRYTFQNTKEELSFGNSKWNFALLLCVLFFPPIQSHSESILCGFLCVGIPFVFHYILENRSQKSIPKIAMFWGVGGLIIAFYTDSQHIWSAMWCSLLFMFWCFLIQIQALAQHMRSYNLLSLISVVLIFVGMEGYIRGTYAGRLWSNQGSRTEMNDMFGWIDKANRGFALLEQKEHKTYPDEGYPISYKPKKNAMRIVAFGGSSTGGAYQNDDIRDFYPQKMADTLGHSIEVLNQGVGGWTSWHIKEYIMDQVDDLHPDIATFYIGHNDILTSVPLPYKQLYAAWKSNKGQHISHILGDFRLYHALRHMIISARPAKTRAAVPVEHAKENFEIIHKTLQPYNTVMILASEGLAPDPGPMKEYNDMMYDLAKNDQNIYFVDIAQKLHEYPSSQVYLDDCHLTEYGHKLVAQWFIEALENIPK